MAVTYKETIEYVKKSLDDPTYRDYSILAYMLKDFQEVKDADVDSLARLMAYDYCSKGDIQGLLKYLGEDK